MKRDVHHDWRHGYRWPVWRWAGFMVMGLVGFVIFAFVFGIVIMWLWNNIMPFVFKLPRVTYLEAVGLAILARLLFGGHRHSHHSVWMARRFHPYIGRHIPHAHFGHHWEHWNFYEDFWKDEGETAFHAYVKRKTESRESSGEESNC